MADVTPIDVSTPVGKMRILVSDTKQYAWQPDEEPSYRMSDAVLEGYLAIAGGDNKLYGAAANALRAIAANEILIGKWVKTEDLQTQGAPVGDALRLLAREYDNKQKQDDDDAAVAEFGFEVVSYPYPYHNMEW